MRKFTPKLKISDWWNYAACTIPDNADYGISIPSSAKLPSPLLPKSQRYLKDTWWPQGLIPERVPPISYNRYCKTEREANEMDKNKIQIEDIILNSAGLKNKAKMYIAKYGLFFL